MINVEISMLIKALDNESHQHLEQAAQLCVARGGHEILVEDFMLAALENTNSFWYQVCQQYQISVSDLLAALRQNRKVEVSESTQPVLSKRLVLWLQEAYFYSTLELKVGEVLSGSLLLVMLRNNDGYTFYQQLLQQIPIEKLIQQLQGLIQEAKDQSSNTGVQPMVNTQAQEDILSQYTQDLTQQAKDGNIDPVLCRDTEIQQMIDILARRRKNNPIIVGDAGVGKTSLAEGLALKIATGEMPKNLANVRLLSLSLTLLQAGASVKGEFEKRLTKVIEAVQSSATPIILFIDEVHTLMGAGEQGNDAANILKPALARGELRTIGATTWSEYKKYIEKDPALARRFQAVKVDEPSIEDGITILQGLVGTYEQTHRVHVRNDAVVAAVQLSAKYLTGRQLPDKAIDLLDTACARVKLSLSSPPPALSQAQNQLIQLDRRIQAMVRDEKLGITIDTEKLEEFEQALSELQLATDQQQVQWKQQTQLVNDLLALRAKLYGTDSTFENEVSDNTADDTTNESALNEDEKQAIAQEIEALKQQLEESVIHYEVTPTLIGEIISQWTGVSLGTLMTQDNQKILGLYPELQKQIKGQDQALVALEQAIHAVAAGLNNPETPTGVFLFVGPSGVGKTQTAQAISELMYGGSKFLTVINMSEYQEKHALSRLIGSPPGYVGYGQGGVLTEAVSQKPYSVILLDEVEKGHPDIMDLFYQIFDKGSANDGEGKLIDFKNTLIIMTSNLASDIIETLCQGEDRPSTPTLIDQIRPTLNQYFKPALVARMNVIPFYALNQETLRELVALSLNKLGKLLEKQKIELTYDEAVSEKIASACMISETGARNIEAIINSQLKPTLSRGILTCPTPIYGIHLQLDDAGEFAFSFDVETSPELLADLEVEQENEVALGNEKMASDEQDDQKEQNEKGESDA